MISLDFTLSTPPPAAPAGGGVPPPSAADAAAPAFGNVLRQLMGHAPPGATNGDSADEADAVRDGEALLAFLCADGAVTMPPAQVPPVGAALPATSDSTTGGTVPGEAALARADVMPIPAAASMPAAVTSDTGPSMAALAMPENAAAVPTAGPHPPMPAPESSTFVVPPAPSLALPAAADGPPTDPLPGVPTSQAAPSDTPDVQALTAPRAGARHDIPAGAEDGPQPDTPPQEAAARPVPPSFFRAVEQAADADSGRMSAVPRSWAVPTGDHADESTEAPPVAARPAGARAVDAPLPAMTDLPRVSTSASVAPAAPAQGSPAEAPSDIDVSSQMVRSMRLLAADGGGEARVRLKPEYLGDVVIVLKVVNGAVSASVRADSPAVRQWTEANEHALRQGLGTHGLRLEQLTVSDAEVRPSTPERQAGDDSREPGERPRQQRPRRDDPGSAHERFEVVL